MPWVLECGWLHAGDQIDEPYLGYVEREKAAGVRLAEESLRAIEQARPVLHSEAYTNLHD